MRGESGKEKVRKSQRGEIRSAEEPSENKRQYRKTMQKGDDQEEQEWKNSCLKGGGNQRNRADKKGEDEEKGAEDMESQMELEEEQRRRVQTRRRGRTDEQEKGGEFEGRGVLYENR